MKEFQDGDPLFGAMMHAIANLWPNGTAVLSGCAPTGSSTARQITVASGTVVIDGTGVSVSQQTKTLDAATFDRYDLVSINTSGVAVVTKGTEERRVPAIPANTVPIAICLIETGQAALPADRIYDTRMDVMRLFAITIDADKNWNSKNITNVGAITANSFMAETIRQRTYDTIHCPQYITALDNRCNLLAGTKTLIDNNRIMELNGGPHVREAIRVPLTHHSTQIHLECNITSITNYPRWSIFLLDKNNNGIEIHHTYIDNRLYIRNRDGTTKESISLPIISGVMESIVVDLNCDDNTVVADVNDTVVSTSAFTEASDITKIEFYGAVVDIYSTTTQITAPFVLDSTGFLEISGIPLV